MIKPPAPIRGIEASTPVLVLSASPRAGRAPHGGIGIIRSLGRLGIPVYTVDSNPRGPASYSSYLRGRFVFDLATAAPDAAVEFLLEVGKDLGSQALLIPTWDEVSLLVSDFHEPLSERFLIPQQPAGLARSLASKKGMYFLAKAHSIPTPEATFPSGIGEVRDFAAKATFPVMLKGIAGNRLQLRTGKKMVIVERPEDLVRLYLEMEDPDEPNLMLQEYIPGGDDVVWMFNGYFDRDSDCLAGFTGRKLRQTPVYTGATSLGICLKNKVVEETTRRWMKELGYRGVLDIGYRYDARDGQYKVLDANPRIGGTFRLFVARNGLDVARALYLDITGQPVPVAEQIEGRKWADERDVMSCLQYRRDGKLTVRQWGSSLRGVQETVHFARDDLAPFWRAWSYFLHDAVGAKRPRTGVRPEAERQEQVDRHFESAADYWKAIYQERTVFGIIHQERRATALHWIDDLTLPDGAPVLEIGCGAGLTARALAERGFSVTATDSVPAMISLTDRLARDHDLTSRIRTSVADAHSLPFEDRSYALVVALGVLPWLHSSGRAVDEIARVLRPGAFMLVNVDNVFRLHYLLDPRLNPLLASVRPSVGRWLRRAGVIRSTQPTPVRQESPRRFDVTIARAGLSKVREATIGFGPFTFWNRPAFSEQTGIQLHHKLQDLADRDVPLVRGLGAQYLVLARKANDN